MATEGIDPAGWERFLEAFALQHRGWLITVETASAGTHETGARATWRPMGGVTG